MKREKEIIILEFSLYANICKHILYVLSKHILYSIYTALVYIISILKHILYIICMLCIFILSKKEQEINKGNENTPMEIKREIPWKKAEDLRGQLNLRRGREGRG